MNKFLMLIIVTFIATNVNCVDCPQRDHVPQREDLPEVFLWKEKGM